MSGPALEWRYLAVVGAARKAVRDVISHSRTPSLLAPWADDMVADVVEWAWRRHSVGRKSSRRWYVVAAHGARSKMFRRQFRFAESGAVHVERDAIGGGDPDAALTLWRLQRIWPNLLPVEQEAAFALMTGETGPEFRSRTGLADLKVVVHRLRGFLQNPTATDNRRPQSVAYSKSRPSRKVSP